MPCGSRLDLGGLRTCLAVGREIRESLRGIGIRKNHRPGVGKKNKRELSRSVLSYIKLTRSSKARHQPAKACTAAVRNTTGVQI
jgi:hypothetical protein